MKDSQTTLNDLKREVIAMCRRRGWGKEGIQNPQHVCMAMLVEVLELLELFTNGRELSVPDIAEETADVLMYGMQLTYTLGYDVSRDLFPTCSDASTMVEKLKTLCGHPGMKPAEQAADLATKARFVLEAVQWMTDAQVELLTSGQLPEKASEIGAAFAGLFRETLLLANLLRFDIASAIERKIEIVDRRVYPADDPER